MAELTVTLATRKSALALAQSRAFAEQLVQANPGLRVQELLVTTTGDRIQDRTLNEIGGKGLFVKEIEEALLDGRADLAVHSLKDVPPELPAGLVIGCYPLREDPRDVLVSRDGRKLTELAHASRVGTSSLRRRVQLELVRPDLHVEVLRGNVDTRLRKCREGVVDAIVLARAGMVRLGIAEQATEVLDASIMLPAVGQGALGIEHRSDDARVAALLAPLAHSDTKIAVLVERGVMRAVEGSCQTPVAAYAERAGDGILLRGLLAEPDGSRLRRAEIRGAWPSDAAEAERFGSAFGADLRSRG
ncbi:MAG: hydroxymethylbilane synthase [Myxococcota bacterium]